MKTVFHKQLTKRPSIAPEELIAQPGGLFTGTQRGFASQSFTQSAGNAPALTPPELALVDSVGGMNYSQTFRDEVVARLNELNAAITQLQANVATVNAFAGQIAAALNVTTEQTQ